MWGVVGQDVKSGLSALNRWASRRGADGSDRIVPTMTQSQRQLPQVFRVSSQYFGLQVDHLFDNMTSVIQYLDSDTSLRVPGWMCS